MALKVYTTCIILWLSRHRKTQIPKLFVKDREDGGDGWAYGILDYIMHIVYDSIFNDNLVILFLISVVEKSFLIIIQRKKKSFLMGTGVQNLTLISFNP